MKSDGLHHFRAIKPISDLNDLTSSELSCGDRQRSRADLRLSVLVLS